MPRTPQLSREVLEAALAGLEGQRDRLETQISEVRALLGRRAAAASAAPKTPAAEVPARRKRRMSAAGRKRIAEAAKKRWAEWKKQRSAGA